MPPESPLYPRKRTFKICLEVPASWTVAGAKPIEKETAFTFVPAQGIILRDGALPVVSNVW